MPIAISVALFGALGALSRYGVDLLIERHTDTVFPVSTFAINVSGCLLAGVAVGAIVDLGSVGAGLGGVYLGLLLVGR